MANRTIAISGQPYDPQIHVDGSNISPGVRNITVRYERNHHPTVEIEIDAHMVELTELGVREPDFAISLPSEAREALIALGWTPPAGDQ